MPVTERGLYAMTTLAQTTNWPLWRTAWRRMRRRPFQYVLFILGVALGVAMMVSIDLASGSASRAFQLSTDAIVGKTTHRLLGGPAGLNQTLYTDLRSSDLDLPLAPVVEGFVLVPELGEQPFRLMGVDPFAEPPFRDYLAASAAGDIAALGTFLSVPNSVIISAEVGAEYGLEVGDSFTIDNAGTIETVTVAGLLEPSDDIAREALSSLIFSDIATAQEILAQDTLSHIDLIAASDADLDAVAAMLPAEVRLQSASAGSNTVQQMTAAFDTNLRALSLLALVVGMFLIYNTVTFSVVQRRKLFGILRCLGVTSQQLFQLIVAEALILSFVGALLGLILGVLLGQVMVRLVTQTINDFYFVVSVRGVAISPWSLLRGIGVGMGAALLASLVPAWEAMRTAPNAGLRRSSIESQSRRAIPWLTGAFVVLAVVGSFLLWLRGVGLVVSFTGLFAILIGSALLTPALTILLMKALARPANALFGAIGRMATRDIVRSLSRTAIAIAALMTAVSVIVGVSIMIGSFRGTVTQWLGETLQADIFVSPPTLTASRVTGTIEPEVVDLITEWPGVADVITARQVDVLSPDLGRQLKLVASNGDVSNGARQYAWQALEGDALWQAFENGEGVFISEPLLLQNDLPIPPPPIQLTTANGPQTFPVLAVSYDYSSDQGAVLIHSADYVALWNDDQITTMAVFVESGVAADNVLAGMETALAGRNDIILQSNQGIRNNALAIFDRTFAITSALQLLATLVAFIGVLSALMSLQLERARELGVLRATGMTLSQLWRLTLGSDRIDGGTAGLLAIPTGYVLAWVLIHVINVRSFGWTLQMELQPIYFIQALAVALIAALLAGIYPALRLGQLPIAAAVRQD